MQADAASAGPRGFGVSFARMRAPLAPTSLALALFACNAGSGGREDESGGATTGGGSSSFGASTQGTSGPTPTTGPAEETGSTGAADEATTGDATTGDATTGEAPPDDEALLRQAIAGEVDPEEALRTIAGRGGLPVETATGGFLFACLCGQGSWNLTGDHNAWADDPLQQAGDLWWIEAEIAEPDGSLYKFHGAPPMGDEAWNADPWGRRYGYDVNGRYTLVRASAAHLERWFDLAGEGLLPRDLQVYVPEGGAFTHALYVHDGQNLFDPQAIWGGWHLQESLPPEVLVIGIDNTPARVDEYTHVPDLLDGEELGGLAPAYAAFLEGVVRPRMEAAYGEPLVRGTMGSSLGGLVSLVLADLAPGDWDMAISLSGTLGWGSIGANNETVIERYLAAGKRDFAIYLDSGGEGPCADSDMDGIDDDLESGDNYCENAQMRAVLQGVGYVEGEDLIYVHEPGAAHNEMAWAGRVGVPLAAFAAL